MRNYKIVIQNNRLLTVGWLMENFGGPYEYKYNISEYGYAGPTWYVWSCVDDPLRKITGEFDNEEDAILFQLRWQ